VGVTGGGLRQQHEAGVDKNRGMMKHPAHDRMPDERVAGHPDARRASRWSVEGDANPRALALSRISEF
jgi:hypothetical protein